MPHTAPFNDRAIRIDEKPEPPYPPIHLTPKGLCHGAPAPFNDRAVRMDTGTLPPDG